ncbi:MAG TPA: DNA primase [Dehalococcoidales bacterium]|nr:DNA primase [Dehalococcoidales bacterium]
MSTIDEIKQKTDIVEVIGQYVTLKKAGRNLSAPCPFHSEKHASFFVFPERQSWHCFGACATGGDVFAFLMKKEGIEFGEALRLLADKAGVVLPTFTQPGPKKEEKEEYFKANEAAALYWNNLFLYSPAADKARKYVAKRGFTDKTIADFQIGFSLDAWEALKAYLIERGHKEADLLTAGLLYQGEDGKTHDRFRGKVMIPIKDARGRVTGFGSRVLDNSEPKYINSPQSPAFDKSATLYGIDRAAAEIRKLDFAIIMEGYMDVIMAHQYGVANAVASMGTSITETQVNTLKKLTRHLVLSLDADAAGEEAMLRTVGSENVLGAEIKVIRLPEGKDPDEVLLEGVEKWQDLVKNASPLIDFMFEKTTAKLDLAKAGDKSAAAEKLLPVLAGINDPIRQAHYLQKLAALVKVDMNTIRESLNRLKPAAVRRRPTAPKAMAHTGKDLREEYCLALLLQHPELKENLGELIPEYFENSENRTIFQAYAACADVVSLKESVDPAIHEHIDTVAAREIPSVKNNIEAKFIDCTQTLEDKYWKNLAARIAESGNEGAEIDLEQVMEISRQRKEIDERRSRKRTPR